jgi:hypothetical protein
MPKSFINVFVFATKGKANKGGLDMLVESLNYSPPQHDVSMVYLACAWQGKKKKKRQTKH